MSSYEKQNYSTCYCEIQVPINGLLNLTGSKNSLIKKKVTLVQHLICKLFTLNKLMERKHQSEMNDLHVLK